MATSRPSVSWTPPTRDEPRASLEALTSPPPFARAFHLAPSSPPRPPPPPRSLADFSINVGALLSYILSPVFKARLGYGFAFLVPAALMALAVIVLVRGRGGYAVVLPKRGAGAPDSPVFVLAKVLFFAAASSLRRLFSLSSSPPPASFLAGARDGGSSVTAKNVSDASDFFRTARFALLMPFFWCLYDQQGSVWILQARRMRTPGWIEPEQLGVLNTVLVLALLPLLERAVYVFSHSEHPSSARLR